MQEYYINIWDLSQLKYKKMLKKLKICVIINIYALLRYTSICELLKKRVENDYENN